MQLILGTEGFGPWDRCMMRDGFGFPLIYLLLRNDLDTSTCSLSLVNLVEPL